MRGTFPFGEVVLAAAGFATLCLAMPALAPTLVGPRHAEGLHPVAALAWAQAKCQTVYSVEPSAPRLQADQLLKMSGDLDALEAQLGHEQACAFAVTRAEEVASHDEPDASPPGPIASVR